MGLTLKRMQTKVRLGKAVGERSLNPLTVNLVDRKDTLNSLALTNPSQPTDILRTGWTTLSDESPLAIYSSVVSPQKMSPTAIYPARTLSLSLC